MSRAFFDQIDDEVRGLLGPVSSSFKVQRSARLIKIWSASPHFHFEAQLISPRWAPKGMRQPVVEVGLHLESPSSNENQRALESILESKSWRRRLPRAEAGKVLGPQAGCRRLSEMVESPQGGGSANEVLDDPDYASEIAFLLVKYVQALAQVLDSALSSRLSRSR